MRPGQNKRLRGRNNNNGRKGPNPLTRSFESNGPDVKIRGTAQHVAEKYLQLARDAQTSGDIVMAENLLQHAEHYFRLIAAAQQQSTNAYGRQSFEAENDIEDDDDDFTGIPDRFAPLAERLPPAPPAFAAPAGLFGSAAASAAAFRAAAAVRRTALHRATTPRTSESPGAAAVPRTSRPQPGSRRIGPRPGSRARPQCRARRRDRRARSSHGVRAQPRSQQIPAAGRAGFHWRTAHGSRDRHPRGTARFHHRASGDRRLPKTRTARRRNAGGGAASGA